MASNNSLLFAPGLNLGGGSGGGYSNTLAGSWVQDSAGNVFWLETATDLQGNVTYIYYDQPGGTVQVPTGDVEPVQDSNIQIIERIDDVNGDGSLLVKFYRLNVYDEDGAILASIPQNADGTTYTVQGNELDASESIEALLEAGNAIAADTQTNTANIDASTAATASSTANIDASTAATASSTANIDASTAQTEVNTAAIAADVQALEERLAGSLINFEFDEIDLSYVSSGAATGEIETAEYKLSGSTVATITLSYDAATGQLNNVIRV